MKRSIAAILFLATIAVREADGTPPFSAVPVMPLVSAAYSIPPSQFTVWNGALYFSNFDPAKGAELWKYDGSTAQVVTDINPGAASSSPQNLIPFGNDLYFSATDGTHGQELWKFDGQTATMVQDLVPGSGSPSLSQGAVYNGMLYYGASTPATGREIFRTDGNTFSLVADINPGSGSGAGEPPEFTSFGGNLYFKAEYDDTFARLYSYNGSQVTLLSQTHLETPYAQPTVFGGKLLVVQSGGQTILTYNGSQFSPLVQSTNVANYGDITPLGNQLVFTGQTTANGVELFHYDGQSISLLHEFTPGTANTDFGDLMEADGRIFLVERSSINPWSIWTYDGTTLESVPGATDINFPSGLTLFGDSLYFTAQNGNDYWLYRIQDVPEPPAIPIAIVGMMLLAVIKFRAVHRPRMRETSM